MSTLTIDVELPEAEYQFATALPPEERHRVASVAASAALAAARDMSPDGDEEGWADPTPFTRDEIDGLSEAVAQQNAGSGIDGVCISSVCTAKKFEQPIDKPLVHPLPDVVGKTYPPDRSWLSARSAARIEASVMSGCQP